MFPSFTGSARPRRNVNLSGRTNNPFAPSIAQSAQNTLAHAQRERVLRQRERERPPAAVKIQRVWRGHTTRRKIRGQWRQQWDRVEETLYDDRETLLNQLVLLVQFASINSDEDVQRVQRYGRRFESIQKPTAGPGLTSRWASPLLRLARIIISVLSRSAQAVRRKLLDFEILLGLLHFIVRTVPETMHLPFREYYMAVAEVSRLFVTDRSLMVHLGSLSDTLLAPMVESHKVFDQKADLVYGNFASEFLTTGDLDVLHDPSSTHGKVLLNQVAAVIDFAFLTKAINRLLQPQGSSGKGLLNRKSHNSLLWLLSYYIHFDHHRKVTRKISVPHDSERASDESLQMSIVSRLISHLAAEIKHRTDASMGFQYDDFEGERRGNKNVYEPLAPFVREELERLSSRETIGGLVARLDIDAVGHSDQASALASLLLTLVRVFPSKGDEIRMWLYQGPSQQGLPVVKYLYKALAATEVFGSIRKSPREAVVLLRADVGDRNSTHRSPSLGGQEQQWRIVLLFIELYSFVLTIMDDEEFLSGSYVVQKSQSRMRQNALPIDDVKDLSLFLKNLCFAMYWNLADIVGMERDDPSESSIAQYFATKPTSISKQNLTQPTEQPSSLSEPALAGMPGMTLKHVRAIASALLRRLYERDSRRRVLPEDHWLMTEHFSMDHFITAVVQEEDQKRAWQSEGLSDSDVSDGSEDAEDRVETESPDRLVGVQRARDVRRAEVLKREQRRRSNRRAVGSITPRLEIIQNLPFFVPFDTRVQIFRTFVKADQLRRRHFSDPDEWRVAMMQLSPGNIGRHQAQVHRQAIFDDAFDSFYGLGDGLKEPIQITFVDEFDIPEEGIDGGGVTKEFLTSVTNEVLKPSGSSDFFVENEQRLLYPNPSIIDERRELLHAAGVKPTTEITELLRRYEFLGRIVGKCLYEGVLVDIHFAPFFLLKWALTGGSTSATNETHYRASINDLRDMDESLYQGLLSVKNYPGDVRDLDLSFEITDPISPSQTLTRELRPNGSSIPVTNENRPLYLTLIARHRLQNQPRHQTAAFLKGLGSIIAPNWLSMFNQPELQTLVGGSTSALDVADLRAHTVYGGLYAPGFDGVPHTTVSTFWAVVSEDFTDEDRRKLLKFVTSTPRAPLLGFAALEPRFCIRDAGNDEMRLPSTSTCINLLKLPVYKDRKVLREKLTYSINAGAGFNLS